MLDVEKDTHKNVSIVPPGFNAGANLEARQLADECFSRNDEMLRYLLISWVRLHKGTQGTTGFCYIVAIAGW